MVARTLDAFLTKGTVDGNVLAGRDTFIGPVQSVRIESVGLEAIWKPHYIHTVIAQTLSVGRSVSTEPLTLGLAVKHMALK